MSTFPLQTFDTSRGRAAARCTVKPSVEDAMPLVLIHGWPESSYSWAAAVRHLPNCWVIAPDLRGMGDAPRDADLAAYSKDQLALDVLALLDTLGIDQAVVVGHDWGGIVAQEVALTAPARVRGLGIANIAVVNNLDTNREIARTSQNRFMWYQHFLHTELAEAFIPGNEAAWVGYFLRAWRPEGFPTDVIKEVVRYHQIPGTAKATANYYRVYDRDIKRWNALVGYRFSMPSLYVHGIHDVVITSDYLNGIDGCFDDVRVVRIAAGHFVQDEQPAAVAEAILSLLSRVQ